MLAKGCQMAVSRAAFLVQSQVPPRVCFFGRLRDAPRTVASIQSRYCRTSSNSAQPQPESESREIPQLSPPPVSVPDRLLQRIEIICQGNESAVLKSYATFIEMVCQHLGIEKLPIEFLKETRQRHNLLKGPFKHKNHRVQYELRTYAMRITVLKLTGSTADTFLEYIQRMCPENVAMKVSEYELQKFPAGLQTIIDDIRDARISCDQDKKSTGKC